MTYNSEDYKIIAKASIGSHSRVSNYKFDNKTEELEYDLIEQELKEIITKMYPNWTTINIEIKAKKEVTP